mgnify:CR=1 FL=1
MTEGATSMGSELNTALTTSVKPTTIISEFKDIMPWIGLMVAAGFIIYEAKKKYVYSTFF